MAKRPTGSQPCCCPGSTAPPGASGYIPRSGKPGLRVRLAGADAVHICTLGDVPIVEAGSPRDGFYLLRRLLRSVSDEG
ncbi:hypothetical protein [Nocardia sp. NPDC050412]|uniref:hypothetical protein n=1 Tax=Nocardia sp. NPDC050412 TaxID=3364320 RepID=UPI003796C2B5